jgi:hypothetical protein
MAEERFKQFLTCQKLLEIADFSSIIGSFTRRKKLKNGKTKRCYRQIKKATSRQFSAEEKIRIVLEGLRGETAHRPRAWNRP